MVYNYSSHVNANQEAYGILLANIVLPDPCALWALSNYVGDFMLESFHAIKEIRENRKRNVVKIYEENQRSKPKRCWRKKLRCSKLGKVVRKCNSMFKLPFKKQQ